MHKDVGNPEDGLLRVDASVLAKPRKRPDTVTAMIDPAFLSLSGVTRQLDGRTILASVSLGIAKGSLVALVGPSGSGKTSLLKAINRLAPSDEGDIRLEGVSTQAIEPHLLRRRIGYAFQGVGLFPHMTVGENIAVSLRLQGADPADQLHRVTELLDLVGLPQDFARRMPASLSGGQAQRVGLARALAARPSLMLLDEPFGALDPVTREELGRAYLALHYRLALTTIMVTHDMAEALLLADRVVVLIEGRVRADLPPAQLATGHVDPAVNALVDVPLRQAARLSALSEGR